VVYVAEGEGVAIVAGHRRRLAGGDVLVIRAGERHQITNTGRRLLRTLSVYAPPAY
jgi:mannose-6-phosphate isomerase-like protein (cupin superfamily)